MLVSIRYHFGDVHLARCMEISSRRILAEHRIRINTMISRLQNSKQIPASVYLSEH